MALKIAVSFVYIRSLFLHHPLRDFSMEFRGGGGDFKASAGGWVNYAQSPPGAAGDILSPSLHYM